MLWRSVRAGYARLGDILIRRGRITHADLQTALAAARADGRSLGETLTRLNLVSATDIEAALKDQRSARWLNEQLAEALKNAPVDPRHEPA